MFLVGLDLGQSQDYSALCVIEHTTEHAPGGEARYAVRHLQRWPLGTQYPVIVQEVVTLLGQAPLAHPETRLVVDQTGVGRAVCDLFCTQEVRPHGVTITGGTEATRDDLYHLKVPKRELVSTLVALLQTGRLKIAEGLAAAPALLRELANFKLKVNLETGHDSYEAWRESIHDDLVLACAIACWFGECGIGALPFGWYAHLQPPAAVPTPPESDEARIGRRMAARGLSPDGRPLSEEQQLAQSLPDFAERTARAQQGPGLPRRQRWPFSTADAADAGATAENGASHT